MDLIRAKINIQVPRWVSIKATTTCSNNKANFCASYKCGVCEIKNYEFAPETCFQVPHIPTLFVKVKCTPDKVPEPANGPVTVKTGNTNVETLSPAVIGAIVGGGLAFLVIGGFVLYQRVFANRPSK